MVDSTSVGPSQRESVKRKVQCTVTLESSASTVTSSLIDRTIASPRPVRIAGSGPAQVEGSAMPDEVRAERTDTTIAAGP
jgi:hypothetical protein